MNSEVEKVREHYERFPYPTYPIYARARWRDLKHVDFSSWAVKRGVKEAWVAGCGTLSPVMFGRRNPGVRIVASDLSSRSLRILRARLFLYGLHNVSVKRQNLLESSYMESFDAIDAYGVLHHLPDPVAGLRRLAEALRSEGVLRLMLYSRSSRASLELVRDQVRTAGIEDLQEAMSVARSKGVSSDNEAELSTCSGQADALLHPLVHTYEESDLRELISQVPSLKIRSLEQKGNYLIFCEKNKC